MDGGLALQPFARLLPLVFLSPLGGMVSDKVNRRNLVVYTLLFKALLSIILLLLVRTEVVQIWHIIVLALLHGVATAFNHPARHTLVPNLVKKEHLLNAVTLDNTSTNASRVVGMPLAGLLIAWFGTGPVFGLRAVGCLLAVVWLLMARVPATPNDGKRRNRWRELVEGFVYLKGHTMVLAQVCMYFFSYFATQGYSSFLPIFATDILKVGPVQYGWLQGAAGVGALVGLFVLASVVDFRRKGLYLFVSGTAMTLAIFFFALSPWLIASLLLLVIVGAMNNTYQTVNNTIIQTQIPDNVRGRVMSIRELISGLGPLSGMLVGWLAGYMGVQSTVAIVSLGFFGAIVLLAFLLPGVRKYTS
ncbi:MAG: major facilitator superfamily 1 [Dehalococcoidia bacterium]|nr:major facilitator superfamily 1 [Dehalococcoidia bacterium]